MVSLPDALDEIFINSVSTQPLGQGHNISFSQAFVHGCLRLALNHQESC